MEVVKEEILVVRLGDLLLERVRELRLCRELRRLEDELRRLERYLFRLLLRLLGDLDLLAVWGRCCLEDLGLDDLIVGIDLESFGVVGVAASNGGMMLLCLVWSVDIGISCCFTLLFDFVDNDDDDLVVEFNREIGGDGADTKAARPDEIFFIEKLLMLVGFVVASVAIGVWAESKFFCSCWWLSFEILLLDSFRVFLSSETSWSL